MKKPPGITLLSILLLAAAVALLVRTLQMHVGGFMGISRLVVVIAFTIMAIGLWMLHNSARIFLAFLLTADILSGLVALGVYALRRSNYRMGCFHLPHASQRRSIFRQHHRRGTRDLGERRHSVHCGRRRSQAPVWTALWLPSH